MDPKTGQPLWAEPDFDDSKWENVDLTPKDGAFDPVTGVSDFVPGWAAKGRPGHWGYAWYRIRVRVQARQGEALAGPADVDDAYQLFDNGKLAGHWGDFSGSKPVYYYTQPKMFPLASGESIRVLAFRLWMSPQLRSFLDVGGTHSAPLLGEAAAITAHYQMRWLKKIRANASLAFDALLFSLLGVVAFTLILFGRSDRVYLWMGALFLLTAIGNALNSMGACTELLSFGIDNLILDGVDPATRIAWVMVWWVWFGRQRPLWLPKVAAGLPVLLMVAYILADDFFSGLIPHEVAVHFWDVSLVLRVALFAPLLWIVIEGIRKQDVEGWLVVARRWPMPATLPRT
jgi:hypothetical protein